MSSAAPVTKKPTVQRKYLMPEEVRKLIRAAKGRGRYGERDAVMIQMAYRHGLRVSELCGLTWDQIDLEHGLLHVRRLKSGKDSTQSMDQDEVRALRKLAAEAHGAMHVFTTERGTPFSADAFQRVCKAAGEAAELPIPVHPHHLRHACGFSLINGGHDVRTTQDFLGHRNVANTVIYTELTPGRVAKVRVR